MDLAAISRSAEKGMGGIKYFLVAQRDDAKAIAVDSVNGTADIGSYLPTDFLKFKCNKETSNWVETGTGVVTTGAVSYEQIATLIFDKTEVSKRNVVEKLGKVETILVAVDRNGNAFILGAEEGMDMTSSVNGSGTAAGDLNGYTITLRGLEATPAQSVAIAAFLVA